MKNGLFWIACGLIGLCFSPAFAAEGHNYSTPPHGKTGERPVLIAPPQQASDRIAGETGTRLLKVSQQEDHRVKALLAHAA